MKSFLTVVLLILAILLIILVLLQPDKSQTTAKNMATITQEKDGIEKLTIYVSVLFIVLSAVLMIISKVNG